jgi:ubiquinone/menaquinone biosynthesis C-methylase UbiE
MKANIDVHSKMAKDYSTSEPHFRPENIQKVTGILQDFVKDRDKGRALDLGCGTGFMINILKNLYKEIDGVDITQAMLDQVNKSGKAAIRLHCHDTGSYKAEPAAADLVTIYSFIHHLYDVKPTLKTAFNALHKNGQLFIGLEPNYYFWEAIRETKSHTRKVDEIVAREIRALDEDETVAAKLGIATEVLEKAEYSKSIKGGFKEEDLTEALTTIGFKNIRVVYDWFLGEANIVNDNSISMPERLAKAKAVDTALKRQLPLSRHLFKYLFVFAER